MLMILVVVTKLLSTVQIRVWKKNKKKNKSLKKIAFACLEK